MNKEGILVDAGTALAPGAVSRIDPCGKYLIFYSHKGREALADKFGAALVSALGMSVKRPPTPGRIWPPLPHSSSTRWPRRSAPGWG